MQLRGSEIHLQHGKQIQATISVSNNYTAVCREQSEIGLYVQHLRLSVENKAKFSQLEIVNKQYWGGGV